jgi:hypothetical protein
MTLTSLSLTSRFSSLMYSLNVGVNLKERRDRKV